jgi:hypothetical protein
VSCLWVKVPNAIDEDPNDKSRTRRSRMCSCWWKEGGACLVRWRAAAMHHFFAWAARIVIFLLWLLLGLPHVTTTNLAETNIRQATDVTTIEV